MRSYVVTDREKKEIDIQLGIEPKLQLTALTLRYYII